MTASPDEPEAEESLIFAASPQRQQGEAVPYWHCGPASHSVSAFKEARTCPIGAIFLIFGNKRVRFRGIWCLGSEFDFNVAYFTGWGFDNGYASYTATGLTVEGYKGTQLVGSVSMSLRANGYDYLTANFANVTELVFIASGPSDNYRWWLMDNFTYNEPIASAVPEPSGLALLGTASVAFAGYFGWRRRKQIVMA